jgi:methylenetetrahydrofolate--tRNA-(uracil-5-)-methyltransferase
VLAETLQTRTRPDLLFAGQISGVEGYTESAATGLLAGLNAARLARGLDPVTLPAETMLGSLCRYITRAEPKGYQPTNAAFGLMPMPEGVRRKRERKEARVARSRKALAAWIAADEDRALPAPSIPEAEGAPPGPVAADGAAP